MPYDESHNKTPGLPEARHSWREYLLGSRRAVAVRSFALAFARHTFGLTFDLPIPTYSARFGSAPPAPPPPPFPIPSHRKEVPMHKTWRQTVTTSRALRAVPLGLVLLAAAGCGEVYNTRFTSPGYKDAAAANDTEAGKYYAGAVKETANEPYYALNLASAYQAQGRMDLAAPYYRQALDQGKDVRPAKVTSGSVNRTLAEIACDNLKLAPAAPAATALPCQPVLPPPPPPPPAPVAQAAPPAVVPPVVVPPVPVQTPPPAVARPAQQLARNVAMAIYFDFDKSALTADGRAIVESVIREAKNDPAVRILLVGKADKAGPNDYNQRLSERRATAVRDALIAGGIPVSRIDNRGVGEEQPDVATADGVREPRNRVVEITLR